VQVNESQLAPIRGKRPGVGGERGETDQA
jgi:hypothetical protein